MYLVCQQRSKGYLYGNIYVAACAYQCCSLDNKQQTIQKNTNLQVLQLRQIGKYPRWKLFDFVVLQISARTRLITITAYLMTTTISQKKNPYHSLSQFLSYQVIAIVLPSLCTGNCTCVHRKRSFSLENGTMLQTLFARGTQREDSSNHLNIVLLNVFQYLNGRYRHIFIPQKFFHLFGFPS